MDDPKVMLSEAKHQPRRRETRAAWLMSEASLQVPCGALADASLRSALTDEEKHG